MKKIVLFFLISIFSFQVLNAIGIKGTIVDSGDQTPLDFVNVALFKQGSKTPVVGVITDKFGVFNIPSVTSGKYNLRISYVGYSTINQVLAVEGKSVNVGTIKMDEDSKKLGEVEVVGQNSQMHFDIDKKVFSVDQNIAAAGGSASDVLKNIPSVTVDNDGNVSLRKDGNVEVWINGKASGLTADNRAQVLQQMPAESIESVEIMTNPSAKFSPEGSAGIINIVMKQQHKAGYYGSVSGGLSMPDNGKLGKNLGGSINYSSSKFDAYINLGYRAMSFNGGGNTNRRSWTGSDTTLLKQNNSMNTSFSGLFMRAGIDYHLDKKNTVGLSGFGMSGSGNQQTSTQYSLTNIATNPATPLRDYSQINTGTGTRPSLNLNMDYKHDFDKKGSNLVASVSYSNHNRGGGNNYLQKNSSGNPTSNISQSADSKNTEWDLKVDYTNKISESSKLEAGWESTLTNRTSSTSGIDNLGTVATDIPSYYDNFNYDEQIHATYLTYGNKIDKLSYQLGLRGELLTKKSTNISKVGETNVDAIQVIPSKNFFHVFPSVYLSYSLPNYSELQLNYSNRVNRPRGQQINPFKNFSDSTNITYGNPDLKPQYSSSLELNYVKSWDAQSLSTSLYYHNTDDVIQNVRFLHNGVMESTYANVTKSQNAGLELISKNRLFKILSLTSSFNLYYSKLDSSSYENPYDRTLKIPIVGQSSVSWSANILANFMLSKTFSGQITGEYDSQQIIAQGTKDPKYSIDLGVRQTFLNRNLSVSLNVRDILNSDRTKTTTSGSGFSQYSSSYFHGRMYGVSVSYNFGNMKPKMSELKKKEAAPDVMDNGE